MMFLKMALKNIKHKKFKYVIMFLLISITGIGLFSESILLNGMQNGVKRAQDRLGADMVIVPSGYQQNVENALFNGVPCTLTFDSTITSKIKSIDGIEESTNQLYLATLPGSGCCESEIQLIAINAEDDFLISPWLKDNKISSLDANEIILGFDFSVAVGETITYYNKDFTVVGIMEETGIGYDKSAFISFEAAEEIIKNEENKGKFNFDSAFDVCSMIFIRSKGLNPDILRHEISKKINSDVINVYSIDSKISDFSNEVNKFKIFGTIMNIMIIILTTISLFAINTITIIQRRNEVGSMLTVGITKWQIMGVFLTEHLIISLSSIAFCVMIITTITILFETSMQSLITIPFILSGELFLKTILELLIINVIIIIISLSCSFTWIYRKSPSEMIKEV